MKSSLSNFFISKIRLKISGKRSERFIHKLALMNIELLDIKYAKKDNIYIWIYKKDYPTVYRLKSIYNMEVVDARGWIKIRKILFVNKFYIFSVIVGILVFKLLTSLVFDINVIHNNKETREFILLELKNYGIDKYKFKKNFKELNRIKEDILFKYKDKIEWVEIEEHGVKYTVRVQLREIIAKKESLPNRNLVAAKDAIIKKIIAYDGQIVKSLNSYVKKGDIIVSGSITLNDNTKGYTSANGRVFGEVWYNMTVEYPYIYYEEKYTDKIKNNIVFSFLNWKFSIPFINNSYKIIKQKIIFNNDLIPFKISFDKQRQIQVIDQVLTEDETINAAMLLASEKMKKELEPYEHIISQKNLKINIKDSKIVLDVFFVVYEDITDYNEIKIEAIE